jgi:hypothetical protein
MATTWDWLWDRLHDNSWRWHEKAPEERFFSFLDAVLLCVHSGHFQKALRGERRRRLLEEIARGQTALAALMAFSFLKISEKDRLRRIEERLTNMENAIREYPGMAPHVKFMGQAAQAMRFLLGAPHYEHVANMTNALFEVEVSADAVRQAENRDPEKRVLDEEELRRAFEALEKEPILDEAEEIERRLNASWAQITREVSSEDREPDYGTEEFNQMIDALMDAIDLQNRRAENRAVVWYKTHAESQANAEFRDKIRLAQIRDKNRPVEDILDEVFVEIAAKCPTDKTTAEIASKCPTDKTPT